MTDPVKTSILPQNVLDELAATRSVNPLNTLAQPRVIKRLEQKEYFKLYKWMEAAVPAFRPGTTNAQAARAATEALGFEVTEWQFKGALETTDMKLPRAKTELPLHEKVTRLAVVLDAVLERMALNLKPTEAQCEALRDQLKDLL